MTTKHKQSLIVAIDQAIRQYAECAHVYRKEAARTAWNAALTSYVISSSGAECKRLVRRF